MEAIVGGVKERIVREHNELAWLAWHVAAMTRSKKKLPDLKKLLSKTTSGKKQDWQQQMAVMDMWVAHTQRIQRQRKKQHGR